MSVRTYSKHHASEVIVATSADALFAELDDHERLSAHMMQSSPMMAGSAMNFEFDDRHGKVVGSEIRMSGTMMGIRLDVREVVTERRPPERKVWETIGEPHLVVIGHYRMGFAIAAAEGGSRLTVFIDYNDPSGAMAPLGWLLGSFYARWCTESMANGAKAKFA